LTDQILFTEERAGALKLGFVALNSPRSLNALDLEMLRALGEKLLEWRGREDVACVVLHAESDKAFCAGGDVKALALLLQES
jgi:enoyl-CoA hydratase/carnithine racemase